MRWTQLSLALAVLLATHIDAFSVPIKRTKVPRDVYRAIRRRSGPLTADQGLPGGSLLGGGGEVGGGQASKDSFSYESGPRGAQLVKPPVASGQHKSQGLVSGSPPASAENSAGGNGKAQTATQALKYTDEYVYTMDVHFGPDQQNVPLLIDTGSFTFWAAGATCAECKEAGMAAALPVDPAKCTKYETAYGAGSLEGCLVNSTVSFGPYTLDGIAMAAATTVAPELLKHGKHFSGMFGLAMPFRPETTTPISYMLDKGLVDSPWVGFRLFREGEGDSELIFGDALDSKYAKAKKHIEVKQVDNGASAVYNITLDGVTIHGTQIKDSMMKDRGVLLDTGTSNIVVPASRHEGIVNALSSSTGEGILYHPVSSDPIFKCDAFKPDKVAMEFDIGGQKWGVPWKDIIGEPLTYKALMGPSNTDPKFKDKIPTDQSGYCVSRIQTNGEEIWILGDAFLVNVYHAINCLTGAVQLWGLE